MAATPMAWPTLRMVVWMPPDCEASRSLTARATMVVGLGGDDAGASAGHGQAQPHEAVDLRAVQREGHGDEGAGHHDVADLDDAARVGVGHKLRNAQREDEGGDADGQRHDAHEHRGPAGNELQVGGQEDSLERP